jgi:hypothetical protein
MTDASLSTQTAEEAVIDRLETLIAANYAAGMDEFEQVTALNANGFDEVYTGQCCSFVYDTGRPAFCDGATRIAVEVDGADHVFWLDGGYEGTERPDV